MTKAISGLDYEQVLAMISDLQWIPEKGCIRLALECGNDALAGNPILDCLNRFSVVIERQGLQSPLSGRTVQLLLSKLAVQYELLQRIDGDSVATMVNRLVENIGVNLVLIGFGNGYATALALILRICYHLEFNRFCDFVERQTWKIDMDQVGSRSRSESETGNGLHRRQMQGPVVVNDAYELAAPESDSGDPQGPSRMTELEEEDEYDLTSGPPVATATNTAGRTHGWRFKKFKLR